MGISGHDLTGRRETIVIEKDPTPIEDGGFRPGAIFGEQEFRIGVAGGVFATGTIVRIGEKRYEVRMGRVISVDVKPEPQPTKTTQQPEPVAIAGQYHVGWKSKSGPVRGYCLETYPLELCEQICDHFNEKFPHLLHYPVLSDREEKS